MHRWPPNPSSNTAKGVNMENESDNNRQSAQTSQALLKEQAKLLARLVEIGSLLSGQELPAKIEPWEIDKEAYAIGLMVKHPEWSSKKIAKETRASRQMLYSSQWGKHIGALLKARRAAKQDAAERHKDYTEDEEIE